MSRELERQAIATHFQDTWNAADGPIAWPNKHFDTPNNSSFCVFSILELGSFRRSLGINQFFKRHEGVLQIDIYVPQSHGTKPSREIADRLEPIYQDLLLRLPNGQALVFGTPSARTLAPNEQRAANLEDNWDRYVFEVRYHRDQLVEK